MAKGKKGRKSKAKSAGTKSTIAGHSYGGRKFACYGKRVKAGRKKTKVPRIFCARADK